MPLKHTTETFLVILLAFAVALEGILTSTLPDLPEGLKPWLLVFVLSIIYPLTLSRFFRVNRADNVFRFLHWLPSILVLLWFGLQSLRLLTDQLSPVLSFFTWGWTLPGVAAGFLLLILFCLRVVRRWKPRVLMLGLLLAIFAASSVVSEQQKLSLKLASALWEGDFWLRGTGTGARMIGDKNLEPSEDSVEEAYRERLRALEERRQRIAGRLKEYMPAAASASSASSSVTLGQTSSMPSRLPSSGFGWGAIALTMLGLYGGVVHGRARGRVRQ